MDVTGLLVAIGLVALTAAIYAYLQSRKYPPGPYGLPVLGYAPFIGKLSHVTFANLRHKYGNVISVNIGTTTVVILNDAEAVKEALVGQGETFGGRPLMNAISDGGKQSHTIAMGDGPIWKEQKRFSMRALRDLGFGRSSIEGGVVFEVEKLSDFLKTKDGEPVKITEMLFLPVANIICKITCGKRYEKGDPEFQQVREGLEYMKTLKFDKTHFFPWLRKLIPKRFLADDLTKGGQMMLGYITGQMSSHWANLNDNSLQDFMDMYLAEIRRTERANGAEKAPFTRVHLMSTMMDMFFAGTETTEATLLWGLLFIAHNPKAQTKVQQELDGLVAVDSTLSFSSKALAPYTQATLMEVHRCASLAPVALPHRTVRDTVLLGHPIPKDTMVLPNLYAVHHDERHWGDPEAFRPERFLDAEGAVINDDNLLPFSIGPRLCPGESMARMSLFVFFTCLMRRFAFSFVPGEAKPSLEPGTVGSAVKPYSYSLVVKCRE